MKKVILIAVVGIAMALPAPAEGKTVKLVSTLSETIRDAGCRPIYAWLPVVRLENHLVLESDVRSLRGGESINIHDGCALGAPSKSLLARVRRQAEVEVKAQQAAKIEAELQVLREQNVRLAADLAVARQDKIPSEKDGAAAGSFAAKEKLQYAGFGAGVGVLLALTAHVLWRKRLRKVADVVYRRRKVIDPETGETVEYFSTAQFTVGCQHCSAKDIFPTRESMLAHYRRVHAGLRQRQVPLPKKVPLRAV